MIDTYNLSTISNWNPDRALKADDAALQPFLTFETKEEYLAWRAEWRTAYRELSERIRELRPQWRAEGSDHQPQLHHALFTCRALARSMMALRAASKVKAEALYQASKEASAVA